MAPRKASRLLEDPPSASPSQEHEEEPEEEEEEVEESVTEESVEEEFEEGQEEEENDFIQETPEISKLSQIPQNQGGDESSEEDEDETDNDNGKHSPTGSSFIVKPAVNKNNHSKEPTKPKVKRALIDAKERKDPSKRTKVVKDLPQEDKVDTPKKAASATGGRVWSSDDVIAILEGMINYQKQKGADPHADKVAFLEFVKGRFGFEVTRTQLYEKVRSLKKKFMSNLQKGESFIPTKPHDIECFELSKKIWGANNGAGGEANSGSNANDIVVPNGVDHTEHVKIIDGDLVTKKSANGKSSEGKRKEKGEKKKKVSEKKKKKKTDHGTSIVEKEVRSVTDDDVVNDKEDVVMDDLNVVENEVEPVTDEDVSKVIEDVVKDYEVVMEKEDEPVTGEDVKKDKEDVVNDDENIVEDTPQNIMLKYPNLIDSLSLDMPESQRKIMKEGLCLIDSEIARELEDRWKELLIKEGEFYVRKMELMLEQSRLLVDAVKQNR